MMPFKPPSSCIPQFFLFLITHWVEIVKHHILEDPFMKTDSKMFLNSPLVFGWFIFTCNSRIAEHKKAGNQVNLCRDFQFLSKAIKRP